MFALVYYSPMVEEGRQIDGGQAASVPETSEGLPGIRNLGTIDRKVFTDRTALLRATGPNRNAYYMRLPRGEIRGVGETGARQHAPKPESFHEILPEALTGGIIFDATSRGEIEA
jgi:hypothetical protein